MIRVAIYCRVSTDFDVSLKSLENQILAYIDLVQNNPDWHLQGIYSDRGLSGTGMKHRTSFQRLLRHCEEGSIDLIITKSISRFSRNTHDLLGVLRTLRQRHIDVIFEKEGIRMSEADNEFILTMYAAIAQQEAVNISQNIAWAYNRRALAGKPKFRRLYGYRVIGSGQNQMLEPIPEEADVVKSIFNQFIHGKSYADIINDLATRGIQTLHGEPVWTRNNLTRLLSNIKYTGNSRIIKKPSKLADLQTDMSPPPDDILVTNSHPAIISQDHFDQAQAIIRQRYTPRTEASSPPKRNLLAARIRCGHCGANFVLIQQSTRGLSLICATRRKNKQFCPSSRLKEYQLLDLTRQAIRQRYALENEQAIPLMRSDLLRSCDLDHAEEERLRRIIEIAKIGQRIRSIHGNAGLNHQKQSLEHDFQQFEQHLAVAEKDQSIRLKLVDHLSNVISLDAFITDLLLEEACALIPAAEVFSPDDALMIWHDHQRTEIGHCQPAMMPLRRTSDATRDTRQIQTDEPIVEPANEKAVIAQSTLQINPLLRSFQSTLNDKLRVCAYCRTSAAEEQHISSLARQIATYTHLIMTHPNYEFAGIYSDHGKSGLSINRRSSFQQMIDDAKSGRFDLIITKSVSRFGRNVVDVLATVRLLKSLAHPVTVLFENESLRSDSAQCDFMLSLHSAVAQNEAYSTSENIRWSNIKSITNGTYQHPGLLPYGYSKNSNGEWMIKDDQANIIRRIFRSYNDGQTPYAIAMQLTKENIPTHGGHRHWRPATVYRMINNIAYRGHHLYARLFKPDMTSDKRRTNRGETDQYLIEDHHPAIIDQATWDMARNVSESRSRLKRHQGTQSNLTSDQAERHKLFRDRLICGLCQQSMFHRRHTYKDQVYSYWKCKASVQSVQFERCHLKSIRQEIIEHGIMIALMRIKHHNQWQTQVDTYIETITPDSSIDQSITQLELQKDQLFHKINTYVTTEKEENIQLIDRITAAAEDIISIDEQLNQLEHSKKIAIDTIDYLNRLSHTLDGVPDFDPNRERISFRTDIFAHLIKSVEIFNQSTIQCNFCFDYSEKVIMTEINLHKLPLV